MICPRLLALYAFLRYMGACSMAQAILDKEWHPSPREVEAALYSGMFDYQAELAIRALWRYVPFELERDAALRLLEDKMWHEYYRSNDESFRQQIWCLYYELPPSAERLPF